MKTRINDLYKDREKIKVEERSSTFRDFTNEDFIEGKGGFSPEDFLELVKYSLTNSMRIIVKEVKLIMRCMMKHFKTNELKDMNFDSGYPPVNLDDDDESEIYDERLKKY